MFLFTHVDFSYIKKKNPDSNSLSECFATLCTFRSENPKFYQCLYRWQRYENYP